MSQPHYSTKKSNVLRAEIFQVEAVSQLLVLKISPEHVFDLLCQYFQWPQLQLSHFSKLIWTNKVRAEYWLELATATAGLDCYKTCKCLRAYSDWLYGDFTVVIWSWTAHKLSPRQIYLLPKQKLLALSLSPRQLSPRQQSEPKPKTNKSVCDFHNRSNNLFLWVWKTNNLIFFKIVLCGKM